MLEHGSPPTACRSKVRSAAATGPCRDQDGFDARRSAWPRAEAHFWRGGRRAAQTLRPSVAQLVAASAWRVRCTSRRGRGDAMKSSEAVMERAGDGTHAGTATMKALVYHGPGRRSWEEKPRPRIKDATDAVVRITTTTICGTDLHILKGDVPSVTDGRILGHEGVGIVEEIGTAVTGIHKGDTVLISCITSCGRCAPCKRGMYSHCKDGGWILGQHHRRHPGRVRADPPRGHEPLPPPAERGRGSDGHAQRHPAHRLRVRRAQRPGEAGRHRGHRRRRPHRPRRADDGAALLAVGDLHGRPRRQAARGGAHDGRDQAW